MKKVELEDHEISNILVALLIASKQPNVDANGMKVLLSIHEKLKRQTDEVEE